MSGYEPVSFDDWIKHNADLLDLSARLVRMDSRCPRCEGLGQEECCRCQGRGVVPAHTYQCELTDKELMTAATIEYERQVAADRKKWDAAQGEHLDNDDREIDHAKDR